MTDSQYAYQWYTPCGQLLALNVLETGALEAHLFTRDGEALAVPTIAMAHLEQWYKAEQSHTQLSQSANERLHFVQDTMDRVAHVNHAQMGKGLSAHYDEMHRMRIHAASMKQIREVALQRALVSADRAMMHDKKPAHGHYAPVVALGAQRKQRSKIDY